MVSVITRLRLDACLYDPAPVREAGKRGRPCAQRQSATQTCCSASTILRRSGRNTRCPGMGEQRARWRSRPARLCGINLLFPPVAIRWVLIRDPEGHYEPLALLCTDQDAEAVQIVEWFVLRWTVEVTFHEVRAHLGVETQRQWSDLAILRTTPALLGLFSLVTIFAQQLLGEQPFPIRQAAWYTQSLADLFRYARFRSSASLALRLFFGVVQRRRHRSNSTSAFRSPRGDARFCCLDEYISSEKFG